MISKNLNIGLGDRLQFNSSLRKDIIDPLLISIPLKNGGVLIVSKNMKRSAEADRILQALKKALSIPDDVLLNLKRAVNDPLIISLPLKAEYVPGESPYFVLEDGTIVQSEDGHRFKPEE
jgi:hypothetical protein